MGLFDDFRELLNWAFSGIEYSVGAGGRNRPDDVKKVQILLNAHSGYKGPKLETDSDCGPNTRRAILAFQRSEVRSIAPDGRVDPGGKTFRTLRSGSSSSGGSAPSPTVSGSIARFEDEIRLIFDPRDWNDFVKALDFGKLPRVKKFLGTINQNLAATDFAKVFKSLKDWGLKPRDIDKIFGQASKLGTLTALKAFAEINKSAGNVSKLLNFVSSPSGKKELTLALIDCLRYMKRDDYGRVFKRLVEMSIKHPPSVVALLHGLQTLAYVSLPEHRAKFKAFRKIVTVINPAGFSQSTIKSLAVFVDVAIQKSVFGNSNNIYLIIEKLAQRLRGSGRKTIYAAGKTLEQAAKDLLGKNDRRSWEEYIESIVS